MEFRVLGRLDVLCDGEPRDVGSSKQRAVLAALLLSANEAMSVNYLMESVWWSPPAAARANLRLYLTGLRRALRPSFGEGSRLRTHRASGYQLQVLPGELDLDRFNRHVDQGEHELRADRISAAADYFERALRIWRGRTLDGLVGGPMLQAKTTQVEERRIRTAERWAKLRLNLQQPRDVVADMRLLIAEHPLREPLWGYLMIGLCQSGRPGEALAAFAELRTSLAQELGAHPGPQLQRLHAQILRHDDRLAPGRVDSLDGPIVIGSDVPTREPAINTPSPATLPPLRRQRAHRPASWT
jgi:DNA-binding SARP family transcriptional activator